jgi:hypothetical protein
MMINGVESWTDLKDLVFKTISDFAQEIVTKVLKTQILCLAKTEGEICINGDQLQHMFDQTGTQDMTIPNISTTTISQTVETASSTATSTATITDATEFILPIATNTATSSLLIGI